MQGDSNNNACKINDSRENKEFKGVSFSGFKKTEVKKQFLNTLSKSEIETSCYWSAELICAGHYIDVWDTILLFYGKHVHLGNPKLSVYIESRINSFKTLMEKEFVELHLRNNEIMRKLFCEMICLLCYAKQKHSFDEVKIKETDFNVIYLAEHLKAPHTHYIDSLYLENDPKELYIASNELAFHISEQGKNIIDSCFWMEWIMEYDNLCKQKKTYLVCEIREFAPTKKTECVWLIWDIILRESEKEIHNDLTRKILKSLLALYGVKYGPSSFKKRKYLLYFAAALLTEYVDYTVELVKEEHKCAIQEIVKNVNSIYGQIKKNETQPIETKDKDVKQKNWEKTVEKLEKMNEFENGFVPRTHT
jgi:hypothetical protein